MDYDLVVVGGGPAGLAASLSASYLKLKTVVVESGQAGGALVNKYPWKTVAEYLGFNKMTGAEVAKKMVDHVLAEGVVVRENETASDVKREDAGLLVLTDKGSYPCKAVVLAIGLGLPQKLGVPGEGLKNVLFCLSDPQVCRGKRVLVVGGGNTAVECALKLDGIASQTTIAHRRDSFRASEDNVGELKKGGVEVLFNTEIKEILGSGKVEGVRMVDLKSSREFTWSFDYVLLSLGAVSNQDFLGKIGVKLDEQNNVVVDRDSRTSIEGVFAAGDVVGRWRRIPEAVGSGSYAGFSSYKYIKQPYWG